MTMTRVVCAALLMVGCWGAAWSAAALEVPAGTRAQAKSQVTGRPLVITFLDRFTSAPGEDKTAFLTRVGGYMEAVSAATTFETCAVVWDRSGGGYQLQVVSSRTHTMCVAVMPAPSDETGLTMETSVLNGQTLPVIIHSHPLVSHYFATQTDESAVGPTERAGSKHEIYNATFSPDDRAAGAGYLVAGHQVMYQDGSGNRHHDQTVGAVTAAALSDAQKEVVDALIADRGPTSH